jgi:uncharacterized protein
MTIHHAALRELHHVLRLLVELRRKRERGPKMIRAAEEKIERVTTELAEAKEALKRTRMTVDDKELQLKSRENRILDLERKRNACSTNKEYQSLMEQIAADKQANSVLSDEIIELLDKREMNATTVKETEARLQAVKQELEKVRARVEEDRGPLDAEVSAMEDRLRNAEQIISPEFREIYMRNVKKHAEEALAPLEDGDICGGCYQTVTPQMINELRLARVIIVCKSCGRILYLQG